MVKVAKNFFNSGSFFIPLKNTEDNNPRLFARKIKLQSIYAMHLQFKNLVTNLNSTICTWLLLFLKNSLFLFGVLRPFCVYAYC